MGLHHGRTVLLLLEYDSVSRDYPSRRTSDHVRKYTMPEEPPYYILWDSIAEIEGRLRRQFPEVFRAAEERRRRQKELLRIKNSI